jgi:chemotaxis protein CheC
MSEHLEFWHESAPGLEVHHMVQEAMKNASRSLSRMVNHAIDIEVPQTKRVALERVATYAGDPEAEVVGIYLLINGDVQGQAILMLPVPDALNLVDLLMGDSPGTASDLGEFERSALAEVGNVTISAFLNAVAESTGRSLRPSPPGVMVDMQGAILNVVVTRAAATSDDLLIVQAVFKDTDKAVQAHFWVLPDPMSQPAKTAAST